jgi:hypothetical protein
MIGGITDRTLQAEDAGVDDGGGDGGDAANVRCLLEDTEEPAPDRATVRLANLVPDDRQVDFCLREDGSPWTESFLRANGESCPAGIGYTQVLFPRQFAPGTWDIKVLDVAQGGGCDGPAMAELNGVAIAASVGTTVVVIGGNGVDPSIIALPEVRTNADNSTRFVNAIPQTEEKVFYSLVSSDRMPASALTNLSGPDGVPFGGVPAQQASTVIGPINEAGYLNFSSTDILFGATRQANNEVVLASKIGTSLKASTLFAVGIPGSTDYPVRGLLCDELGLASDKYYTPCKPTDVPYILTDTININLYGLSAPFEAERREPALDAVAGLQSDVLCVQEITRESDRASLVDRAKTKATFVHSYNPLLDDTTPIDDPTNQNGDSPPDPPIPPCGTQELQDFAQAAADCVQVNCTDDPSSPNGALVSAGSGCMSSKCVGELLPGIMSTDPAQRLCTACIIASFLSEETPAGVVSQCSANPNGGFAFHGASTEIMLSRFPLTDTETYVLPSTNFRRAVLHAVAQIPDGDPVDVFCLQLPSIQDTLFPYGGFYGVETEVDGEVLTTWKAEQYLAAQRALAWIKQRATPGRLAIIAGEFRSSELYPPAGDAIIVDELNPVSVRLFRGDPGLTEAVTDTWEPLCDWCAAPENPYNSSASFWTSHIFTMGSVAKIESFERILTDDNAVTLTEMPLHGPISGSFGLRSKINYRLGW